MAATGTNYTAKWTLSNGTLTIEPQSGDSGSLKQIKQDILSNRLINYMTLTDEEIESVRSIVFEGDIKLLRQGFNSEYYDVETFDELFYSSKPGTLISDPTFSNLTTIDIRGLNTDKMKRIFKVPSPVAEIIGLESLTIDKCTDFSYAFDDSKIETIDISSWNMNNVESIEDFLGNATKTINLPSINADGATSYAAKNLGIAYDDPVIKGACIKATNANGITIYSDDAFWALPESERIGVWTRATNPKDFVLKVTSCTRDAQNATIQCSYETVNEATLSVYLKKAADASFPTTASCTQSYNSGKGTDTIELTSLTSDGQYEAKLVFSDGTTNLYTFVSIGSNKLLLQISPDGDISASGSLSGADLTIGGKNWLDIVYPVGSIYMSANEADPSTLFGGTWDQIQDTFLLASGSSYSAGTTGGEAEHTLSTDELPSHNHGSKSLIGKAQFRAMSTGGNIVDIYTGNSICTYTENGGDSWGNSLTRNTTSQKTDVLTINATHTHSSVGNNTAHNNMPPYLAVYVWKRTA